MLPPAGRSNPRRPRNERAGLILSPAVPRGRGVLELVPTSPCLRRLLNGSQSPSGPVSPKTLCQSQHPGSGRWDRRTRRRAATRHGFGEERARILLCSVPGGGPLAPGVCCRDAASPLGGPAQRWFIQLARHQSWGRTLRVNQGTRCQKHSLMTSGPLKALLGSLPPRTPPSLPPPPHTLFPCPGHPSR